MTKLKSLASAEPGELRCGLVKQLAKAEVRSSLHMIRLACASPCCLCDGEVWVWTHR